MIVTYNFICGVLLMLSSEKIGAIAGHVNQRYADDIARYTRVSTFAVGCCFATIMAFIYVLVFTLKIGV